MFEETHLSKLVAEVRDGGGTVMDDGTQASNYDGFAEVAFRTPEGSFRASLELAADGFSPTDDLRLKIECTEQRTAFVRSEIGSGPELLGQFPALFSRVRSQLSGK